MSFTVAELMRGRDLSSLIRVLVMSIGLLLLALSLAWDTLTGADSSQFGRAQVLGSLTGAFLLGIGALHRDWSTRFPLRWGLVVYALVLGGVSVSLPPVAGDPISKWALAAYLAAICGLLPRHFGIVTFIFGGSVVLVLAWISAVKANVLGLPLTMMDIRIAAAYPTGLTDALGLPSWSWLLIASFGVAVSIIWVIFALYAIRVGLTKISQLESHKISVRTLLIGLFFVAALFEIQTSIEVNAKDQSTWYPKRVTRLSERMGIVPFLAFSYQVESREKQAPFYASGKDNSSPPAQDEINVAIERHTGLSATTDTAHTMLPNIIVALAEATFDPAAIFRLKGNWNSELFRSDHQTKASGLLRVNSVGGGTWIAEFESIVGLDSRLFGQPGMYTHYSLSPFVRQSIATYLEEYGYETLALFGATGEFYNGTRAYTRYGFNRIIDSEELGRGSWFQDDRMIALDLVRTLEHSPVEPFFAYVKFLENHAPHECQTQDSIAFTAQFVDNDEFGPNCLLNDYLHRLANTTAAVQTLREFLLAREDETGRPYVFLVFGDHQPHTFTTSIDNDYDWMPMKKTTDPYLTYFRIDSSLPYPAINCCTEPLPVWSLPTLLSTFVAEKRENAYLGVNLWLYSECGSDATGTEFPRYMNTMTAKAGDTHSERCKMALDKASVAYRDSGIMSIGH